MDGVMKVCNKCGQSKSLESFQRKRKGSEDRRTRCRQCRSQEYKRKPTGRSKGYNGLEGVTPEERAQIHANYLAEKARKDLEQDVLRARMLDSLGYESSDWVRDVLGFGTVEVLRSRTPATLPIPVVLECCDFIDDHYKLMEG